MDEFVIDDYHGANDPTDPPTSQPWPCPPVIVDTREQAPFHFLNIDPWRVVPLVTDVGLATGDYSLKGFEARLTVERKSTGDFLGSITAGRDRFEREFERMSQMLKDPLGGFAVVVVEEELSNVLRYASERTQLRTNSILGTVDAWAMRYGVHWRFCPGRRFAEIQTLKILYQFWRQEQARLKAGPVAATATAPESPDATAIVSRIQAAIVEAEKVGQRTSANWLRGVLTDDNPQDVVSGRTGS